MRPVRRAHQGLAFLAAGALVLSCTWGDRSGGDKKPYKILGRVTHAGAGLEGVTVLFQGEGAPPAVVTGAEGYYEQTDFPAGSFAVIASHGDYEFSPASATVDASTNPTVDFEGVPAGSALQLWSPNGGELLSAGTTARITWNSAGSPGSTVQLDYWDDSAGAWVSIAGGVANADGVNGYDWVVPEEAIDPGPAYVRVISEKYPGILNDRSDGGFTIAGIAITSPDGGETWCHEGEYRLIIWTAHGVPGDVEIHYSTDGGATYPNAIATVAASVGIYAWVIPDESSTQCRVRVQEAGGGGCTGESDADFTIKPATVAVTAPAGGESWNASSPQTITWSSAGFASVRVELSRDGGGTWETIVASTPAAAGTYSWTVTGPASANCVVRISHAVDGVPAALSAAFTVTEPLALTIAPDSVTETAGLLAGAAVVSVPTAVPANLVVGVSSDDETELTVPASVTILAGNTSVTFDLTVVDDAFIDGDKVVTVTATAPAYVSASDTITIQDDESAVLTVAVPAEATEGDGILVGAGTVSVPANVENSVTVVLSSSNISELTVPASVVIAGGTSSVAFDVTVLDDVAVDGDQVVTVTATATGFVTAADSITIRDDDETTAWYVDIDAPGATYDGTSWATAFLHPQDAADVAAAGEEVWVAEGTYPRRGGSDTVVLTMMDGVAVYGGYAGYGEPDPDERGASAHVTTLDGEDIAYHVVVGASNATLDGFTITRGNANGSGSDGNGGGAFSDSVASLTFGNCTFADNVAAFDGGGMYNSYCSVMTVVRCTFTLNLCSSGGGVYNWYSSPDVTDCPFTGNSAADGGGMYNRSSSPTVQNCAFASNSATFNGGGMNNYESSPLLTNCTFTLNAAADGGAMRNHGVSSPVAGNCIIWGDTAAQELMIDGTSSITLTYSCIEGGYTGTGNIDADPKFVDAPGGDLHLLPGSPCIDAADGTTAPATDIEGNPRCDLAAAPNTGVGPPWADMGAHELVPDTLSLSAVQDTFIQQPFPDTNRNGHVYGLHIDSYTAEEAQTLVMFDLSGMPPGSTINSATMKLYCHREDSAGGASDTVQVIRCDSAWDEVTATWNNNSANGSVVVITVNVPDFTAMDLGSDPRNVEPPLSLDVDIAGLVQDWVDGVYSNYGVRLFPNDGNLETRWVDSEDSPMKGAQYVPVLDVTYTP